MKVLIISIITEGLYMTVLPLGAAYVAAAVQDAGHEVDMLNLRSGQDDFDGILKKHIERFKPDIIGISMRNVDDQSMETKVFLLEPVKKAVHICKSYSRAPIVIGGAGFSIFPSEALSYLGADMGIKGEGEGAFVALLEGLEQDRDLSSVPGLYYPEKGLRNKMVIPRTLDHYTMPLPNIHLHIPPETGEEEPIWLPVQTRRGCPMDCSYCSTSSIEGRTLRKHSPERVVENIKAYVKAGVNHFFFVDNTFNFPPSYAEELCDRIIAEKLDIKGRCILYPLNISERLVKKIAKAGIREVSLGFESGSDILLSNFKKRFTIKEVRRISKLLRNEDIFQMGFLMLGGPGETKETALESLEFADELDLDMAKLLVGIRIYPGTDLADTAIKEGKIESHENLLFPKFYVVDELKEWLVETVEKWAKDRPNWLISF